MKLNSVADILLGTLVLASLKSAWLGPVVCGRAKMMSNLGESSSSPYSKRTPAAEQWAREMYNYSEKNEIQYKNKASFFAPSSARRQWLVLEEPKKSGRGNVFPVKPKHIEISCEFLTKGADYHEHYQQGPCKSDVVPVSDLASALGKCAPDLRYRENKLWGADKEHVRFGVPGAATGPTEEVTRNVLAPLNGTGPWHSDGCEPRKDKNKIISFLIDNESHLQNCIEFIDSRIFGWGIITVPVCPNFDPRTNKCPGKVIIKSGPQEPYFKANRGTFNSTSLNS